MGAKRWIGFVLGAVFLLATAPSALAASAYVSDGVNGNVYQFGVGSNGLLSPLSPPFKSPGGSYTSAVAASPRGTALYAAASSAIAQYRIGAGGELTAMSPASVATTGATSEAIAVSPNDKHLYLSDIGGSPGPGVWQYNIATSGTLSLRSKPSATGGTRFPGGACPGPVAISPNSEHVYVVSEPCISSGAQAIREYTVNASGGLTFDKSTAAAGVTGLALSPGGTSLYATALEGNIYEFNVGSGGALSPKSTESISVGTGFNASSIAVSPNGKYAYATANEGDCNSSPTLEILQYTIGAGGLLEPESPASVQPPAGDNVGNIAISGNGSSVYATFDGSCSSAEGGVLQYQVGTGGTLSPDTPADVDAGTNPTGLAVTGAPAPPPPAPKCTLKPQSSNVALSGPKAGKVTLIVRCTQSVSLSLTGRLTEVVGKKSKQYALGPVRGTAEPSVAKSLTVKLPAPAVQGLKAHDKESATFTLAASDASGHAAAHATISQLKGTG